MIPKSLPSDLIRGWEPVSRRSLCSGRPKAGPECKARCLLRRSSRFGCEGWIGGGGEGGAKASQKKTRGGGSGADYINCPLSREQYNAFVDALLAGDKASFHDWEASTPYFDGCLPIEVMAERGRETLRHGPMKPFGLTNPHRPQDKAYAVVQLRQDNKLGTLFNMVGFQTKLKHGEQVRIFRTIPGLEEAEFARLGGLHRHTFLNSPKLLDDTLRLKANPH